MRQNESMRLNEAYLHKFVFMASPKASPCILLNNGIAGSLFIISLKFL